MFCRKCGKEILDSSKFCPYCGNGCMSYTQDISDDNRGDGQPDTIPLESIRHSKKRRKWLIPIVVVAGIAVAASGLALAVNSCKSKSTVSKPADNEVTAAQGTKLDKLDEAKREPEPSINEGTAEKTKEDIYYPKDIKLKAGVQSEVTELLTLLCKIDTSQMGKNFESNKEIDSAFCTSFLIWSIWLELPFADGNAVKLDQNYSGWIILEEVVKEYLQNSIGIAEYAAENIITDGGIVKVGEVTLTGAFDNDIPKIQKVSQVSETDIQVEGIVNYKPVFSVDEPYTAAFAITLTENSESMWGGYTLKEINSWEDNKTTAPDSDYVLPDIASRYYAENELSSMDAQSLYIARNELYARHGYIFNNQGLKQYFSTKSWYRETTTTVSDSDFNKYEKANLDLILALEEKFK